jgi:hypothetical protein
LFCQNIPTKGVKFFIKDVLCFEKSVFFKLKTKKKKKKKVVFKNKKKKKKKKKKTREFLANIAVVFQLVYWTIVHHKSSLSDAHT